MEWSLTRVVEIFYNETDPSNKTIKMSHMDFVVVRCNRKISAQKKNIISEIKNTVLNYNLGSGSVPCSKYLKI